MKLLISDLDGTLYPKADVANKEQLQDNVKAIKKWIAHGNMFVAATARGSYHYPVLKEQMGFPLHFIGSNGAEILFADGESIVKTMPCAVFLDLCKWVKEHHINATVMTGIHGVWTCSNKECYPAKDNPVYNDAKIVDELSADPQIPVFRVQVITPPEDLEAIRALIMEKHYPVNITTSDVDLIDIGPLDSSKGIAIQQICDKYDIDVHDIIVVGDSENDIAMLDMSEHSYCIDHAHEDVKKHATHIVKAVEDVINMELSKEM